MNATGTASPVGLQSPNGDGAGAAFRRRLVLSIPSKLQYLSWARRATEASTRSFELSPTKQLDVTLVASELVTNAIEHGAGGRVHLEIRSDAESVEVTASNVIGDRLPGPPENWSLPEPTARSGRGLAIVRRLCDSVDVREADDRLVISCQLSVLGDP